MGIVEVRPIECRSAVNRVEGMPFKWSLNPYRGCQHDCVYCYARSTHSHFDLGVGSTFGRILFAKTNVANVLEREISRPSWQHESIAIGTATDPYQAIEGKLQLTRRSLAVLAEHGNPCTVITKGTLAVRDRDVMQELSRSTDFTLYLSLSTIDRELCRRLEPGTPPPESRLRAMSILQAAGIPVHVLIMPIIPGMTDRVDQLSAVIRAAADYGAIGVSPAALRLAPGVKEWFVSFLRRERPQLVEAYGRGYESGANAPIAYREQLDRRFAEARSGTSFAVYTKPSRTERIGRQLVLVPSR